jgi:ArsR family transcriptional regulator
MVKKSILHHGHKKHNKEDTYDAYKIFFGTLVSQSRLRIINLLREGEKTVSEMVTTLNYAQPTVSHDLARLKNCGFVNVRIVKNFRHYSLNKKTIEPLMKLIDAHMDDYCLHILHQRRNHHE